MCYFVEFSTNDISMDLSLAKRKLRPVASLRELDSFLVIQHYCALSPRESQRMRESEVNPTPLHDKSLGKIRNSRPIPKHSKKQYTANTKPTSN